MQTRGISVLFHPEKDVVCIDTEGEHRVDAYSLEKQRRATERFHQEVALYICDLILIVIDELDQYSRKYVDDMILRATELSSSNSPKTVFVIHNFKHFGDEKTVQTKINNTILLAYSQELIRRARRKKKFPKFSRFSHQFSPDHNPSKSPQKSYAIQHLIFAKNSTDAGDIWNKQSLEIIEKAVDTAAENLGNSLDINKLITEGFARLMPEYFLAVPTKDETGNNTQSCTVTSDGKQTCSDGESEESWLSGIWNFFTWSSRRTLKSDFSHTNVLSNDILNSDDNPFKTQFVEASEPFPHYKLRLASYQEGEEAKYDYISFPLKENGKALDGYHLPCRAALSNVNKKSYIIECYIPNMELVTSSDSKKFNPGEMVVLDTVDGGGRNVIRIKGIVAKDSEMANTVVTNIEQAFDGPFTYQIQVPRDYTAHNLNQNDMVSYQNGELRIELPFVKRER